MMDRCEQLEPPGDAIETLSKGLDEQHDLLVALRQLAGAQGGLIERGEHASLLTIVQRRDELIKQLDQARGRTMAAIARLDPAQLPESIRTALRERRTQVHTLVDEVAALDQVAMDLLRDHRTNCREELNALSRQTTAAQRYRGSGPAPARFADAQG